MAKIFICYRREDSAYPSHHIYGVLANHFGSESVVFDVNTIPLGIDFRDYLNKEVSKCDILLAVIGDQWVEMLKRRLAEPNDFVRIEIQAALERKIPVVPILVGKTSAPNEEDLPPELAGLAYRNAAEVRAGPDLQTHLKRLIEGLDYLLPGRKAAEKFKKAEKQKRQAVPTSKILKRPERVQLTAPVLKEAKSIMIPAPKGNILNRDIKIVKSTERPQKGDIIKCVICNSVFKFIEEMTVYSNRIMCPTCRQMIDVA